MKHELELELYHKYPKILKKCGGNSRETCMAFWFDSIGDGWFKLIDETLGKIQYLCDFFTKERGEEVQLISEQQKSKFGEYRFYYSTVGANEIQLSLLKDVINGAEDIASMTCENTGDRGYRCQRDGWLATLCEECAWKLGYSACNEYTRKLWEKRAVANTPI